VTATIEPTPSDLVSLAVSGAAPRLRLTAVGEVDSSSAPLLKQHLEALLDGGGTAELTVDLDGVTFLDSAGLCVLAAAHRHAVKRGIRLRVLASARAVIRPMQITGLWELLAAEQVEPGTGSAVA
jgi:anti-sigma B factor antagonist